MWEILTRGGIGLVLLIPKDHPTAVEQLDFYMDAFADFIRDTGVVIGLTRSDLTDNTVITDFQERLYERNQVYPVFDIDARSGDDVNILIHALLATLVT